MKYVIFINRYHFILSLPPTALSTPTHTHLAGLFLPHKQSPLLLKGKLVLFRQTNKRTFPVERKVRFQGFRDGVRI